MGKIQTSPVESAKADIEEIRETLDRFEEIVNQYADWYAGVDVELPEPRFYLDDEGTSLMWEDDTWILEVYACDGFEWHFYSRKPYRHGPLETLDFGIMLGEGNAESGQEKG